MTMPRKKELIKAKILSEHGCSGACSKCALKHSMIDNMDTANIPVGYWSLRMKDFNGPEELKKIVKDYVSNIKDNYISGTSICFAGNQGTGKTMSSTYILKCVLRNGFSAYYTTASDMFSQMVNAGTANSASYLFRTIDFLVIDELDSRFFVSDSAKQLFSSVYENIFRYRTHNLLPTIICTNETNGILDVFYGPSVQSIESLNSQYLIIYPVAGRDLRKKSGKHT